MKRFVIVFFSVVILASTAAALRLVAQESQPQVVTISAKRFEFTPNQITLKRGEPVTLRVSAEDRDHGLYQKDLKIDLDLTPDHLSEVTITPAKWTAGSRRRSRRISVRQSTPWRSPSARPSSAPCFCGSSCEARASRGRSALSCLRQRSLRRLPSDGRRLWEA